MINILHCTPWPLGGATTYVVQLAKTLELAGIKHRIVKLAKRTEGRKREIGNFGVFYQNVSYEDAKKSRDPWLLASAPTDDGRARHCVELVEASDGAYVFHDPNEFRIYPHWTYTGDDSKIICIREQGLKTMPSGVFIPHPYVRIGPKPPLGKRNLAVSIARTSAVKNSHWILEANERLPEKKRVVLRGEVNRMWWNFNVKPHNPHWPYPAEPGFPRDYGAAVAICAKYELMVDLTIFKNDGGGTQYSFLEAMDAGAVPVMTEDWCSYPGMAKTFGFQVSGVEELYRLLLNVERDRIEYYRAANFRYLAAHHNPTTIGRRYMDLLYA